MVSVIIAAGGKGTRMGADINKVYLKILGKEILVYTIEAFQKNKNVDEIIIVTGKNDIDRCNELVKKYELSKVVTVVKGGTTRQKSVFNGIMASNGDIVVIHDGARPLISQGEIDAVINDCREYDAAAVGVSVKDTLKMVDENGFIASTIDRELVCSIRTPQVFKRNIIVDAHQKAIEENFEATDDCGLAEFTGVKIKITTGSNYNIKVTTPEDIIFAEGIWKNSN